MFSTLLMTSALVLQAASASTVLDLIAGESRLSTLASALKASGLDATLEGAGPWTVFAPVDDAFSTSPWHDYRVKYLLDPSHKSALISLLKYHVVSGTVTSGQLTDGDRLKTVEGQDLSVHVDGTGTVAIDDVTCSVSRVTATDFRFLPPTPPPTFFLISSRPPDNSLTATHLPASLLHPHLTHAYLTRPKYTKSAAIQTADLKASNGVVHVISAAFT